MGLKKMLIMTLCVTIILLSGAVSYSEAGDRNPCAAKNPCGANPCAVKNPCGSNPCAMKNPCAGADKGTANPCAMKPKPIRKNPVKDYSMLQKMGENLWNSTKLGASGMSCGTCHPNGARLKKEPFPKYIKMADDIVTLDQMINFCMMNPMKGRPLQWNSQEMTALGTYVKDRAAGESDTANPCAMKNPCANK